MFIDLTIAADFSQIRQSEISMVDLTNFSQNQPGGFDDVNEL